jgi:hypothetical protein
MSRSAAPVIPVTAINIKVTAIWMSLKNEGLAVVNRFKPLPTSDAGLKQEKLRQTY